MTTLTKHSIWFMVGAGIYFSVIAFAIYLGIILTVKQTLFIVAMGTLIIFILIQWNRIRRRLNE